MKFQINPLSWKPQLVLGALLAAGVPIAAVAWKSHRASNGVLTIQQVAVDQSGAVDTTKIKSSIDVIHSSTDLSNGAQTSLSANSFGGMQAWFEGSSNPFLTTAQAKERKLQDALSKVEAALMRRGDVQTVFILVDEHAQKNSAGGFVVKSEVNAENVLGKSNAPSRKPKAVVSIRMREGSLPISLADSAGSLVSAALVNVDAEDIEVLDERSGTRVRAQMLDLSSSLAAREALAVAVACEQEEVQNDLQKVLAFTNSPPVVLDVDVLPQSLWTQAWCAVLGVLGLAGTILIWWKYVSRSSSSTSATLANASGALVENINTLQDAAPLGRFQFWSAPLACSLHKCVAEKPALIAATLVQRLEGAPSSRQEVAAMMLELEPWAAERVLGVLPDRSLDVLEHAIKNPGDLVAAQQVRALAEAIVSLRNAA